MFWFVFISIILFIVFLIVILVSSRSSTDKTLTRLKEELEVKKRGSEKQKTPKKTKPEQAKPPRQREEPKVKESVAAAAAIEDLVTVDESALQGSEKESVAAGEIADTQEPVETETPSIVSAEEIFIEEQEPSVAEETPVQEEVAADIVEEAVEENKEVDFTESPSVAEGVAAESSEVTEVFTAEGLTPGVQPVTEEAEAEEAQDIETEEQSASFDEPFITDDAASQPATEVFIEGETAAEPSVEKVSTEAEEESLQEELVSEAAESTPQEVAEEETYSYPPFDNTRAMEEFGLPKEDADEFIVDLIQQIEEEMPALEVAVQTEDNKQIENISHMIKGSATNLGTGGTADVLIDFNTYMKTGNDPLVIAGHMRNLHRSLAELKEQFQ